MKWRLSWRPQLGRAGWHELAKPAPEQPVWIIGKATISWPAIGFGDQQLAKNLTGPESVDDETAARGRGSEGSSRPSLDERGAWLQLTVSTGRHQG